MVAAITAQFQIELLVLFFAYTLTASSQILLLNSKNRRQDERTQKRKLFNIHTSNCKLNLNFKTKYV